MLTLRTVRIVTTGAILLSILLAGCSLNKSPSIPPLSPIESLSPTSSASSPTSEINPDDLPSYTFEVHLDYDANQLTVQQKIVYKNISDVQIPNFLLAVEPNLIAGVFKLNHLRVGDQDLIDYTLNGQELGFQLPVPLQPRQGLVIQLDYDLTLPEVDQGDPNEVRPKIFGVTDRQKNLVDWYPMLVPFSPQAGWQLSPPWYFGENLVYPLANFDLSLQFADSQNVPVVAASAAGTVVENGIHFHLDRARDFVFSMSRQLKVISADVDGVKISSYYYSTDGNAALAVLEATIQAVRTYSALFGPYPHQSLAAVHADFNDGMEYDGLYFLSDSFYNLYDGTPNNYLVMVAAHETSHQWWFGKVGSDQANSPWLDETLATYSEELFYEKNYPDSVKWWWSTRVDFYTPQGKIDGSVNSYDGFDSYTNAVYRRGAHFMADLRTEIGDTIFFAFLTDYAETMAGKIATPSDFFRILRQHTQANLASLLASYFNNTSY